MSDPIWVGADELIDLNCRIVEASGEPHVVLMDDVLRGVANRPYEHWRWKEESDPAALGVSLLIGVARSQTFQQGNKRTGYYGALKFFDYNSLYLDVEDASEYADIIIAICNGEANEDDLVEEFRPLLMPTV